MAKGQFWSGLRSSCHRLLTATLPTVYRRLGSKRELIRQALTGAAGTQLQVPDAGSVDTDLRMLAWAVQVARYAPQGAAITTALIVGGLSAPDRLGHAAVLGRTA